MSQAEQIKPSYRFSPIANLLTLARTLGISQHELLDLSSQADCLYSVREEPKSDGRGTRVIVNAHPLLKRVQGKIKTEFLDKVIYPRYLMGGIKDKIFPRDYKKNAELHSGATILIREDILNYFPSVT
jgi:hypothetical protein